MKNDVTTVEDEVMNDQNEDSAMANLMAFMNMGVVEVEDEDSDVDDMDDVLDFDDEDESELPSKNAGRKRAGGKRKKAEDDDKSDGEDLIEKGIRKRYCLHPVDNPLRSDRPDIKNTKRLLLIMKKPRGTIYNRQTV